MLSANTPAIQARGLRQAYRVGWLWRSREVLRGIDIDLAPGARLGLVGPNGSGKSTLLRLLAGVERASGGELKILGGTHLDPEIRRRVGFLPEDAAFPRELRALEALQLLAALRGVERAQARDRAREGLRAVGLSSSEHAALGSFSRGMLRRFGLAQALVHDPALLLLDEPTAGLDALGLGVFDELLSHCRARNTALVIASHMLSDLQAHCDQLIVLHDGLSAAAGAPSEVLGDGRGLALLEVEGLRDSELPALERSMETHGVRLLSRSPSAEALRALYRRLSQ
jgi:ABC-2 type transport system ATP-binding protein